MASENILKYVLMGAMATIGGIIAKYAVNQIQKKHDPEKQEFEF